MAALRARRRAGPTREGVLKLLESLARSSKTPPRVALDALQTLLEVLPRPELSRPKEPEAKPEPVKPWLRAAGSGGAGP